MYEEISPAVCGVLQGQYVCVMAYGQTGAGKTFTMQVTPNPNYNPMASPNPSPSPDPNSNHDRHHAGKG